MSTPSYPVRLVGGDDLERSRLPVFFRIFLLIPHVIVLVFYGIAALIAAWSRGSRRSSPDAYRTGCTTSSPGTCATTSRVLAYGTILADPFPPFGAGGAYPVDLEIDPPVSQGRLGVFFRLILALPCLFVASVLQNLLYLVAIGNWFVALVTGGVPEGLQKVGMFCMRFMARTHAYALLVNPRYPAFGDTPASLPADQTTLPPLP